MLFSFLHCLRCKTFLLAIVCFALLPLYADGPPPAAETLRYSVNWPSGLSLGEAVLTVAPAANAPTTLQFEADAGIPGFTLRERVRSQVDSSWCSVELEKNSMRGSRTIRETTQFQPGGTALRKTRNGGESRLTTGDCPKDALTFLHFIRAELRRGVLPANRTVYFGAPYAITVRYVGRQRITVAEKLTDADRIDLSIKGPASQNSAELYFALDAPRTPLLMKVPLTLGTFALELVR